MLSLSVIRWLRGYAVLRIVPDPDCRGSAERFLNLTARAGISFWNIRREGDGFEARVAVSQYRSMIGPGRKAGIRFRTVERRGFPFFLRRCLKRKGLFAGAALFLAIQLLMPLYVWNVTVSGCETISPDQVRAACVELGLSPGALKSRVDYTFLQHELMLRFPEISWVSLNTRGCFVTVELKEKVEQPEMVDGEKYCNIVASRAGQVVSIDTYEGTAQVAAGDAVGQGQLLISGVMEDVFGGARLKHAAGRVMAETKRSISVEVPMRETVTSPTGKTVVRRSMNLFGLEIPLSLTGIPQGDYKRETEVASLEVGEVTLPVSILTETWTEEETAEVTLTEEQARKKAEKEMEEKLEAEWKEVEVKEKNVSGKIDGEVYRLTMDCVCEENIAEELEIFTEAGTG